MAIEHEDHAGGHGQLGELPVDVRRERRETYEDEVSPMGPPGVIEEIPGSPAQIPEPPPPLLPVPRDVMGQNVALVDTNKAPFGLPAVNFLVQTTFDARPINGNDFRFENVLAIGPGEDPPVTSASVTFTVPPGRIAILRRVVWTPHTIAPFNPISTTDNGPDAIQSTSIVFARLAVAGSIQRTYERMYRQEGDETVYVIARENETMIFTIFDNPDYSGTTPSQYDGANWTVYFYGNLLDTRGREKQYEPANEYVGDVLK